MILKSLGKYALVMAVFSIALACSPSLEPTYKILFSILVAVICALGKYADELMRNPHFFINDKEGEKTK